ncbi:MAG: proline dehydrogenase [Candidatus Zixiibacteriota bacterium]|nr:MAG: proline dehydrogenase [candidate division Zixibacteria bacterium]
MNLLNQAIAHTLPIVPKPVVGYFSARYISGERLEDAVHTVKKLMDQGACATIDVLGEHITRREESTGYAQQYLGVLDAIVREKLDANISLKPTQMGLKLDRNFCLDTVRGIAQAARERGLFVRIDMEDVTCTDDTFWLYQTLLKEGYPVGVVIQAYLRRTDADLDWLIPLKANLRLCKGIYVEPREHAYKDREIIRMNYLHLLERLLQGGCYTGIATHDEEMVWGATRIIRQLGLPRDRYEFQMLLGVDEELRHIIIQGGHKLRVYVPFGRHWYAYSVRRLKENPAMAGYVLKALFKRRYTNGT